MKRVLTGLVATVAIVVLVVGTPIGLYVAAGAPWPTSTPSWDALLSAVTAPDDGTAFLAVLKVVGWLAWFSFAAMVLLEILARLRGVQVPRLPVLGLQQRAATGLVSGAVLLFTVAPAVGVGVVTSTTAEAAGPSSVEATTSHSSTVDGADRAGSSGGAVSEPARHHVDRAEAETFDYVVRSGDSLWSVAERHLADGSRYAEIAKLNYGRTQPDGGQLSASHWIRPGWTLKIPHTSEPSSQARGRGPTRPGGPVQVERGDTLAQIAEDELGDAGRWPEVFQSNTETVQADGERLVDPDLIYPGWTIEFPGDEPPTGAGARNDEAGRGQQQVDKQGTDASGVGPVLPRSGAAEGAAPGAGDEGTSAGSRAQPPGEPETGRGAGPTVVSPPAARDPQAGVDGPADAGAGAAEQVDPGESVDPDEAAAEAFPVRTVAGVGALLAAGVLGLVATRRSRQQRRRKPGQEVALPHGETERVEQELRAAADPLSVETVDLALRALAAWCADQERPLPVVRAGRLTADQFELYLAEPATLPAPWEGTADATVWTLPGDPTPTPASSDGATADVEAAAELVVADGAGDVAAPYPSLVTVGHDDEDGHVFLDLEYLGALGVQGDAQQTRQVLAAIAVELATSRWADDLQVTIVGAYPELEDSLETGRVRYLPAPGRLLDELERRAEGDRRQLASSGAEDLNHARVTGSAPGTWTPEIVLLAGEISSSQRDQLAQLVEHLPRVAIAAVTRGEAVGEWSITLGEGQSATLEPVGLHLRPQLLDDETYTQILTMLATADHDLYAQPDPGWPAAEPSLEDLPTAETGAGADTGPADEGHPDQSGHLEPADTAAGSPSSDGSQPVDQGAIAERGDAEADGGEDPDEEMGADGHDADGHDADGQSGSAAADGGQELGRPAAEDPLPVSTAPGDVATGTWHEPDVDETNRDDLHPGDDHRDGGEDRGDEPTVAAAEGSATGTAGSGSVPPGAATTRTLVEPEAEQTAEAGEDVGGGRGGEVTLLPRRGPRILMLGNVEIEDAAGVVEPSKRARLAELAAFLNLNPGCDHTTIDAAQWPGKRVSDNTRNTAMSKLRRWMGKTSEGDDFLPRYGSKDGYHFDERVSSDWQQWQLLLPGGPAEASTAALEQALGLVRGRPFDGVRARRYSWAENQKQAMILAIIDASYELARRRLMDGRWRAAGTAAIVGLSIEPGMERLWRVRILAAHASGSPRAVQEAVNRLLAVADDLGGDLEQETEDLLAQLGTDTTPDQRLLAATDTL